MKIKTTTFICIIECFLLTSIPYISQTTNNLVNLALEILLVIWLLSRPIKRQVIYENASIILFMAVSVICTYINVQAGTRTVNALVTGLKYVLLFIVTEQITIKNNYQYVANIFFTYFFVLAVIGDLCILFTGGKGVGSNGALTIYLVGSKFTLSYIHMFLLSLFLDQNYFIKNIKIRKWVFWVLFLYTLTLTRIISCATGTIGCLTIGIIVFFIRKRNKVCEFLSKPIVFVLIFIGSTFLLVGTDLLLNNKFFYDIFRTYSHTTKLLSGRLDMYYVAINAIYKRPAFGYGINSTIVEDVLTWGNAQNGLLKMLLDYGIIGTISFLAVCFHSFSSSNKSDYRTSYPIMAFIYGMAICSMVEINLSAYFFLSLSLLWNSKIYTDKEPTQYGY